MATTNTYAPNQATTWTVPSGVTSITITTLGGGGGSGATDGNGNIARSPGARGRVIATFSVSPGQVVGIYPGYKGANGSTGTNTAGGSGGNDTDPNANYNGGTGGRSGGSGSSGSGGGGGAASTVYIDNILSIVAGGSGGGGGAANVSGSATDGYSSTSQITNQTNGGTGSQTTTSCTSSNDGGGGGGGGGGRWGSVGGGVYVTGSECAGYGGYRGNNFVSATATNTTDGTDSSGSSDGSIQVSYVSAQTISISSLGTSSKTYPYLQTLNISTSGSSGTGAITFSIAAGGTATGCTLSSTASNAQISADSSGTCLITATIAADSNFSSATSSAATFTFNKANQNSLSLTSTSGTYLANLKLLTSGGSDTGTVVFNVSSAGTAGCSITNSDSLTSTSAGTCQVVATKAATNNYLAAYDTQTITLGKASLALSLNVVGSSTAKYGSTVSTSYSSNRTLGTGSIANISGTITYSAVSSPACTINSSGIVTITTASGNCSVRISLASDNNYSDTASELLSINPAKADTVTISASAVNLTYNGSPQSVSYQNTVSGLKFSDALSSITYSYSGNSNSGTSRSGSEFVQEAGTYTITPANASITNFDSYTAVAYATGVLTVNRASRTILGSSIDTIKYGSSSTVTTASNPSSNSDGLISYSSNSSTACSVVSGTGVVTMQRATGTCLITPSISQGNNYLAATGSAVSISPAKADAITVTVGTSSVTYTGSAASITPTYSVSGLVATDTVTVSYQYTGTENSGTIYTLSSSPPTNAGTYSIVPTVTQSNFDSYTAAANLVNGTLAINRSSRSLQATTYDASTIKYGSTTSVISNSTTPSSNSDGVFRYSISEGCSVNSSTGQVTATSSSGTCSQTTTISQGNNYETATAQSVIFTLRKADTITVQVVQPSNVTYSGSSANVSPSISVSGLVNNDNTSGVTYTYSRTTSCATGGTCEIGDTGPGGGIVFYRSNSSINAADGISSGGIYLEAAPSNFSKSTFKWCTGFSNSNSTTIGGTSSLIGSGALNTKIVTARCSGGAVREAASLTLGGKSDWFLPSGDELLEMYNHKNILGFGTGTTAANYYYWGSNETENWVAASLVPANGVGGQNKDQATPYWPIRAFSPTATSYPASTTPPTNAGLYTISPSLLTLNDGRSTNNYIAITYETSTLTIDKANQSIFSNYGSLEAVLGSTFQIYPFGGSGDGAVYLSITNGTANGCVASASSVTAASVGTCTLNVIKSANENYNEAQSTFIISFFYFSPVSAPPVSTRPTEIAIEIPVVWSAIASAAPSITSFSSSSGPAGTVITISGTGFDGVTSVKIGRKPMASFTGISSTAVTAVIPSGATSGPIVISNAFGSDFSVSNFNVTP